MSMLGDYVFSETKLFALQWGKFVTFDYLQPIIMTNYASFSTVLTFSWLMIQSV